MVMIHNIYFSSCECRVCVLMKDITQVNKEQEGTHARTGRELRSMRSCMVKKEEDKQRYNRVFFRATYHESFKIGSFLVFRCHVVSDL